MNLQGARLNNCDIIKEIKEARRRHLQKNLVRVMDLDNPEGPLQPKPFYG